MNPVDDSRFTRPLVKALHRHVEQLAATVPGPDTHDGWARRARISAAWVYLSAVLAWAEDHELVDVWLRGGLRGVPSRFTAKSARPVEALVQAFAGLTVHPATQWLMHPAYNTDLHAGTPSDDGVQALADWWARDAPPLAYDVTAGPPSISGWVIGDLLQSITDERRKGHALAQTPWWVCDLILDRTMLPAVDEFRHERLIRTVDPTAGTGHMLIRAMDYLWDWYTTGRVAPRSAGHAVTGGCPLSPQQSLPRVVASVDGVELDPLTAAVARLRCTVYAADLAHRGGLCRRRPRLDEVPRTLIPRIGVADSLLLGKVSRAEYIHAQPALATLPGASFTGRDWDLDVPTQQPPARLVAIDGQLDLFQPEAS